MVTFMKVNGKLEEHMVKAPLFKNLLMDLIQATPTRETGSMARSTAKESNLGPMELDSKESTRKVKSMAKVPFSWQMVHSIRASSLMESLKASAPTNG